MNRDNSDNITLSLGSLAVFRGIYKRVAVQLDVDPSYVSRVARGERNAPFVTDALRKEIQQVLGKAGLQNGNGDGKNHELSNGNMAAALDGPGDGVNHRNGEHRRKNPSAARTSRDGHSSLDGRRAPSRHHKSKTKTKPSPARQRKS